MQKTNNILIKAAAAILATIFATGCVFEKENPSATRDFQNVLVQIGVNTSGAMQTKAADSFEAGNENAVATLETAVKTLRVYAYIGGQLCGYLYTNNVDTENHALLMDMKLPKAATATVDFVAIANEAGMTIPEGVNLDYTVGRSTDGTLVLSGNAGLNELQQITYTLANQSFTNGMPMYAVGQATLNLHNVGQQNTATGHTGHFILNDEINIELTRSLAKIAVYAAEEGTSTKNNVKINSVTFEDVINNGYLLDNTNYPTATPQDVVLSNTQVTVTKKLNRADTDFATKRKDAANYTQVTSAPYYIPENPAGKKLVVNYTTGSGAAKNAEIEMPEIARNTYYKVLCLVKANGEMTLELVVADWETGTGKYVDFKDDVTFDTSHGLQWNGVKIADVDGAEEKYTLGVAAGSSVTCTFKITAPADGMWYASLTEGDVQNYVFEANGKTTISGSIKDEYSSFTIKALNSNLNSGSSKTVKLVITAVNENGRSMVVNFNDEGYYIVEQAQM